VNTQMQWHCPPPHWREAGNIVKVVTGEQTDFWRNTFYGFVRDNGHFYHRPVAGDFTIEVTTDGKYEQLYDQAGLMLRVDQSNWVKAGIEFTDGAMHFSTVVTRDDFSDWSVIPLPATAGSVTSVRITRHGDALRVQYKFGDHDWQLARLAHLRMGESVAAGLMCCSPQRAGFEVSFHNLSIDKAISRDLHG